jgi:TrmH family RNA methyltransferase
MILSSLQNPKVKQAVRLRDRSERDETGLYIIEGYRENLRYIEKGGHPRSLFFCPSLFLGSNEWPLIEAIQRTGAELCECTPHVFQKLSYRDRPDGLLAVAPQFRLTLQDLEKRFTKDHPPFLVIAEAIEKPGNLGTILRSSDACGVDALIVCDRCTDIFNPNVVRASVGTLFTVPVAEASSSETLPWLKKQGIRILAATPAAKVEFTQVNLKEPVAIAVGTEQLGLSDQWMDGADIQVKIPMCGIADSLNVAMATTLLLYEVFRQRR